MNQTVLFEETLKPVAIPEVVNRWAVRCVDCLSVAFIEEEPPVRYSAETLICGCCVGKIESMGKVTKAARLTEEATVSVCDDRCTHAAGPKCVCHCGCKNHGSGKVKRVVRDLGAAPTVEGMPPNALPIAEAWRAAFKEVLDAVQGYLDTFGLGYIADRKVWLRKHRAAKLQSALIKVKDMRSQKARLAKLVKILGDLNALKAEA